MKIVTWNVRCMNKVYKHSEFRSFLSVNNVSLIDVLDNRVKEAKAQTIINKITKHWDWHANYTKSPKGRIWILRDRNKVDYTLVSMMDQLIHGHIRSCTLPTKIWFSAIYGWHTVETRKAFGLNYNL